MERDAAFNKSSPSVVLLGFAHGYDPQDIAEVGDDLTHDLIKGPPGSKAGWWGLSKKALAW